MPDEKPVETDPSELPAHSLARRLRRWADGLPAESRAVTLLIRHGWWLRHRTFVSECVFLIEPDAAAVDWLAISDTLSQDAAPIDAQVLKIARQLARSPGRGLSERDLPQDLRPELVRLITEAIGAEALPPKLEP